MTFEDPERIVKVSKVADYFVDDTSTGGNLDAIPDNRTPLEHLHDTEQAHAHILFAAGHKLALDKCSYYVADFKRRGTNYSYKTINDIPGDLNLCESFDPFTVTVPRLQPSQAQKTLGHFLALDGNQIAHYIALENKMRNWANHIKTSALVGYDRVEAYHAYIEKSMVYMISSSSLSYTQCKKLAGIVSPVLLNAYGINRNCSRTVLFSTHRQGGLNITHPYHLQGQEKLRFFFRHYRDYDTVGKLIDISRRHIQFELGTSTIFLLTF